MIFGKLDHLRSHPFTFGCEISVGFLSGTAECVDGIRLMVGMVVVVDFLEHLASDPEEPANLMFGHTELRLLGNGAVPQRVRGYVFAEASGPRRRSRRLGCRCVQQRANGFNPSLDHLVGAQQK
jgi:hypothetical protein